MKKKFGIIGNPINHSLSPTLHNYWFKKYGLEAEYNIIESKDEDLPKIIDKIRNGLNIYHYLLKLFIALYLIIKFNPIYKIKYRSSNDRNIIFNSGLLLFMSITIIDPVMMISNKLKL